MQGFSHRVTRRAKTVGEVVVVGHHCVTLLPGGRSAEIREKWVCRCLAVGRRDNHAAGLAVCRQLAGDGISFPAATLAMVLAVEGQFWSDGIGIHFENSIVRLL